MQMSMSDIRQIGYRKIYISFRQDVHRMASSFYERNTDNACKAYSFPARWNSISLIPREMGYSGIETAVKSCEPFIDHLNMTLKNREAQAVCRRFRDLWSSIWTEFGEAVDLSASQVSILSDVGLMLAFGSQDNVDLLVSFYNTVLTWAVIMQREGVLKEYGESPLGVVTRMCETDSEDFVKWVEEI